jgi:DUF1009 family protein
MTGWSKGRATDMSENLMIFYGAGSLSADVAKLPRRTAYQERAVTIDLAVLEQLWPHSRMLAEYLPERDRINPFNFSSIQALLRQYTTDYAYFVGDFPLFRALQAHLLNFLPSSADELFLRYLDGADSDLAAPLRYLQAVDRLLRDNGVRPLLASEAFDGLTIGPGTAGRIVPPPRALDWVRGQLERLVADARTQHGLTRISQAAIVDRGFIVDREQRAGTNGLLRAYRRYGGRRDLPTLVKMPTRGFPAALDQPTIGTKTVEECFAAGVRGIVVCAEVTVVAQREQAIRLCDEYGIFLHALELQDLPPDVVPDPQW